MNAIFWNAPATLTEQPESGSVSATGPWTAEITLIYEGPYSACFDANPGYGQCVVGYPTTYIIETWGIERKTGQRGRLTITLSNRVFQSAAQGPTYELEWVREEVDVLQAYSFRAGKSNELTAQDFIDIDCWKKEPDSDVKAAFAYETGDGQWVQLSANAQVAASKILSGVETFTEFRPVVRATTFHSSAPTCTVCGIRSTPPKFANVAGGWLKTADRLLYNGRGWERTREWTGDPVGWDIDLYI